MNSLRAELGEPQIRPEVAALAALNLSHYDPIHALRVLCNFYEKTKRKGLLEGSGADQLLDQLRNARSLVRNSTHANLYLAVIFLISQCDPNDEPEVFRPVINYTWGDCELDERLLPFNLLVRYGEFQGST